VLRTETVSRPLVALAALAVTAGACGKKQDHSDEAVPAPVAAPPVPAEVRPEPVARAPVAAAPVQPPGTAEEPSPPAAAPAEDPPAATTAAPAAPARPEHAVFRLVDNRHAAHRFSDGDLVLDAADIGFARYTRFNVPVTRWRLGKDVDGERAAIADRLAVLEVPLSAEQASGITFVTARVRGVNRQRLTLKVNGRKPGKHATVELVTGWITVAIPVARGYFAAGENHVVLETSGARGKVAVQWLRLGSSIGNRDPRADAAFDAGGDAVSLARDAALAWYVTVPDGAHFVATVTAPCQVELRERRQLRRRPAHLGPLARRPRRHVRPRRQAHADGARVPAGDDRRAADHAARPRAGAAAAGPAAALRAAVGDGCAARRQDPDLHAGRARPHAEPRRAREDQHGVSPVLRAG
jgi:hypothetical protein